MSTPVKPIEPARTLGYEAPPLTASDGARSPRIAVGALLLATLCWGCGFTWAKAGGESVNRLTAVGQGAPLGPVILLAVRFIIAGVLWFTIFPRARRGWSMRSIGRALLIGSLLSAGILLQHLGLDRTSEAVSAFLTSLTIVFVPLISTIALRRPPPLRTWVAVVIAAFGVWLMTGAASGASFGIGELLGLVCAIVFSVHVFAVNAIVPRDDPFRMTGGQFLVLGFAALILTPFLPGGIAALAPARLLGTFVHRDVILPLNLMILFPTIIAFGLCMHFQPRIDATRATLIYLMEPIFASVFAWIAVARPLAGSQILGAAMILFANSLIELLEAWSRKEPAPPEIAPREVV